MPAGCAKGPPKIQVNSAWMPPIPVRLVLQWIETFQNDKGNVYVNGQQQFDR
jgi:hypothetical protein